MNWLSALQDMIISGEGMLLLAAAYVSWWFSGRIPNLFSEKEWSWKRGLEDLCKVLLAGGELVWLIGLANIGAQFFAMLGWDITEPISQASSYVLMGAISGGFVFYASMAVKNTLRFLGLNKFKKDASEGDKEKFEEGKKEIATGTVEAVKTAATNVVEALKEVKGLKKKHETFEQEGGRGAIYVVPVQNYDAFRGTVIGKGYDIDGAYGYQCWDGTALLWQQIGRSLMTGNGCASGCWTLKKDVNAGKDFDLITKLADVKRGDVMVFSTGQYGHIGFADENYNGSGSIKLLGQNQGGTPKGAKGGAGFNVISMSTATFLGAFRFKMWKVENPSTSTPTTPQKANEVIADEVISGKWGNGEDRKKNLQAAGYDYNAIQAIVNAKLAPKTPPAPAPAKATFAVGDIVVPTKAVDYTGRSLVQYDPKYVITSLTGDRAVLSARGSVWAAMNVANLKKA